MKKNLSKLSKVELREVWGDEAKDFTPWLAENIKLLSDSIGIEIIDVKQETDVGSFNADIIAKEANSEDKILIENQLEYTDHDHLGKLVTYASGIGAKYVIWIAQKIREEHQKALEWLNEITEGSISFFAVEVETVKIDESNPAVNFNVIIEPNTWGREIKVKTEEIDERHKKYLQFYNRLVTEYEKIKPEWGHLTARPSSWLAFGAGRAGLRLTWAFRGDNRFNTELYIDTKDKEEIKMIFNELKKNKKIIDKEIAHLSWEELPDRRASRIALYYKMPTSIKKLNEKQLDLLIKWAIEKMNLFKKVFTKYIKDLDI